MALENELSEHNKHLPPYPIDKDSHGGGSEYWTMDRVLRWLDVNDFKPAMEVFKGKSHLLYGQKPTYTYILTPW